jgi:6-phosphogluconolactonase (cycloisomerase 2 family)
MANLGAYGYTMNTTTGALTALTGNPLGNMVLNNGAVNFFDTAGTNFLGLRTASGTQTDVSSYPFNSGTGLLGTINSTHRFTGLPNTWFRNYQKNICYTIQYSNGAVNVFSFNVSTLTWTSVQSLSTTYSPTMMVFEPSGNFCYLLDAAGGVIICYSISATDGSLTYVSSTSTNGTCVDIKLMII